MLAASVVLLALNTAGPANRETTPIGYFRAAILEKDVGRKGDLIESGLVKILYLDADKNGEEVDRLFTLYLGFLAADLPSDINQAIAETAALLSLSEETRVLAIDALDGYLMKLKASKEDVPLPFPKSGGATGIGHGLKPSEWMEQTYLRALKAKKGVTRDKKR